MKRIIFFILLLISFGVDAQVKQKPTTYGIQYRRLQADSGLRIPTVQIGTKDLYAGFDTAQLFYRKSDSALLTYTGSQWILARGASTGGGTWGAITGTLTDQTDLYDSLLARLRITDTAAMLANYRHWLSGYLLGLDTVSLSNRINLKQNISDTNTVDATRYWVAQQGYGNGDSSVYSTNPSDWYVTKHQDNPTFPRAPSGDRSSYVPSGFEGPDGVWWTFVKGDTYPRITKFFSNNKGKTWTYDSVAIAPSPTYQDSIFNLEPYAKLVGDTVYLYYMGGDGPGVYDTHHFGIWQAKCAYADLGNNSPFIRQAAPIISNANFDALMGLGYETGYLALSSIVKKGSTWYYHGGFLTTGVNPRTRIWVGQGSSLNGITSASQVSLPLDSATVGVKGPSVWQEPDGYKMIYSKGDPYYNGGYLMSANSSDLLTWTENPGVFGFPPVDTTLWDAKQIYSGQLMKIQSGNYDQPLLVYSDSLYAGPDSTSMGYYTYLYSGSYDSSEYVDQSGIMRIHPQHSHLQFAVDDNGNYPYSVQRNTTTVFNLPKAGLTKNGYLDSLDYLRFENKADSAGQWSYIHNNSSVTPQDADINIDGNLLASGSSVILGKLSVGSASNPSTFTADAYQHSGAVMTLKNSSNFGISVVTTVTDQITNVFTGTGIGYNAQATSATNGWQEQFFRKVYKPVFYPFLTQVTFFGQATDSTSVEINSIRLPTFGVAHTDNGTTLHVVQQDGYNTTAAARTSYAGRFYNTATRESGANDLTNIALDLRATGGQGNIALRTSSGDVQMWGLPSAKRLKQLYIDSDGKLSSADTSVLNIPTNLTQFVDQTAWRVFYSNGSGDVTELALGADGTFLKSNGATSAPSFATPAGSGDVSKVGTPVNNQVGIWTGDGTLEGDANLTFASSTLNIGVATSSKGVLTLSGNTSGTVTIQPLAAAGTYTLTLPNTDGDPDQFLKTDGNGNLSWAAGGGGITVGTTAITSGTDTRVPFNDAGVYNEDAGLTYNKTTDFLAVGGNGVHGGTAVQNAAGWNRAFTVRDASHAMINTYSSGTGIDLTMVSSNVGGYGGAVGGLFGTVSAHPLTIFTNSVQRLEIDASGNIVINESAVDANFRIESDTYTSAFYVEGTDGTIILQGLASGVTTPTPTGTEHMMTIDANGLIGHRTITGGSTYYNSNVGSAYRWAIPNTNNIKTASAGVGIVIDSATANQNDIAIAGYQAWANNTTTTSDATVTTLATIATPNDSRGTLEVTLIGIETGDVTTGLTGKKFVHWKNVAGTVTVLQVIDEEADYRETFTTATWTVDASSGNLRVRVTGEAATSCTWNSVHKLKYQTYSL